MRTGIPRSVVEEHYLSAEDCLSDAYVEAQRALEAEFAAGLRGGKTWTEALGRAADRMLRHLARHPAEAQLLTVDALRASRQLARARINARDRVLTLCAGVHGTLAGGPIFPIQLELLMGAWFRRITAIVEANDIEHLPDCWDELMEIAAVFDAVPRTPPTLCTRLQGSRRTSSTHLV
jgi:hypothetical protein